MSTVHCMFPYTKKCTEFSASVASFAIHIATRRWSAQLLYPAHMETRKGGPGFEMKKGDLPLTVND